MAEARKLAGDALLLHALFRTEIENQCLFAELAAARLDEGIAEKDAREIWAAIQGILVAAASLSKLLWGSSATPDQMEQREPIRTLGQVTDDSPLRPRKIRNSFEHFDERIEAWVADHPSQRFSSRRIGPDSDKYEGQSYFGHFEPEGGTVTFGDDSISLRDLLDEIRRIRPLIRLPIPES